MHNKQLISLGTALVLLLGACGDDDSGPAEADAPAGSNIERATTDTTAAARTTTPVSTTAGSAADEVCALATELFEQEEFPTVEQLRRYQQLAPESIVDAVNMVTERLIASGGDLVESFSILAEDDVEAAIAEIDAFEEENCGIPHSEDSALPDGATREIDHDASRVDVHATDYRFEIGEVAAGRTSFVLTNDGTETHVLEIVKLADGVTFADALEADGNEGTLVGYWVTGLAAPGGDDEAITFDVEPGNYALACYIPNADGRAHLELGMQHEFTVH